MKRFNFKTFDCKRFEWSNDRFWVCLLWSNTKRRKTNHDDVNVDSLTAAVWVEAWLNGKGSRLVNQRPWLDRVRIPVRSDMFQLPIPRAPCGQHWVSWVKLKTEFPSWEEVGPLLLLLLLLLRCVGNHRSMRWLHSWAFPFLQWKSRLFSTAEHYHVEFHIKSSWVG